MVLLGGATETAHEGIGGFQEWPQLESVRAAVKFAARPAAVELVPRQLERAVRTAVYGRPGPTYVDLPGDLLNTRVPASSVSLGPAPAPPPVTLPAQVNFYFSRRINGEGNKITNRCTQASLAMAANLVRASAKPLVIIGKVDIRYVLELQCLDIMDIVDN